MLQEAQGGRENRRRRLHTRSVTGSGSVTSFFRLLHRFHIVFDVIGSASSIPSSGFFTFPFEDHNGSQRRMHKKLPSSLLVIHE
ncbi:hypothetical protein Q3G72_034990 [Acer saccharum]|nr:hypothetical protein Q3G72_034990 [Acer saccharum]